jgi:hypothetical protein
MTDPKTLKAIDGLKWILWNVPHDEPDSLIHAPVWLLRHVLHALASSPRVETETPAWSALSAIDDALDDFGLPDPIYSKAGGVITTESIVKRIENAVPWLAERQMAYVREQDANEPQPSPEPAQDGLQQLSPREAELLALGLADAAAGRITPLEDIKANLSAQDGARETFGYCAACSCRTCQDIRRLHAGHATPSQHCAICQAKEVV